MASEWCLCIWPHTCLSASDWAAWAIFAATLLAALAGAAAVAAAFKVASTQLIVAESHRLAEQREATLRSLIICEIAIKELQAAVIVILNYKSPILNMSMIYRVADAHAGLVECLKDRIIFEAIAPVMVARDAAAALKEILKDAALPLSDPFVRGFEPTLAGIGISLRRVQAMLEEAKTGAERDARNASKRGCAAPGGANDS